VLPFALFVGTAMPVIAFPVLARILTDRGMHRTRIGGIALASAAIDDVLAWSLLAGGRDRRRRRPAAPAGPGPVYAGVMFGLVRPAAAQADGCLPAAEEILNRLEQVSVLVLLPVFFVVSELSVNLSSVGLSALVELCLILRTYGRGGRAGAAATLVAAQLAVADPAEAGDQSGWWSARGSSRRAHQGTASPRATVRRPLGQLFWPQPPTAAVMLT
jgi:hypothetical protein